MIRASFGLASTVCFTEIFTTLGEKHRQLSDADG
jgi:hypothetical protein